VPVRTVALALAAALVAGCHTVGCTDKACSGSVQVLVDGTAPGDTLDVAVDADTVARCVVPPSGTTTCTAAGVLVVTDDGVDVTIPTAMTAEVPSPTVGVVVTTADGDVILDDDVTTAWSDPTYPNGEACDAPSACWTGTARVGVR
jgi:hypothetical protein